MWNNSDRPVQLFLNNKLDKDVERTLKPFNTILSVFFTSKYKIRNGFITPCEKKYHILLFFTISLSTFVSVFYCISSPDDLYKKCRFILFFVLFMFFLRYALLVSCNILQSQSNVALILRIQDINRNIIFNKNIRKYVFFSWILLFSVIVVNILTTVYFYVLKGSIQFHEASTDILIVQYDLNLAYGIFLKTLLLTYLKEWINNTQQTNNEEINYNYCAKMFKIYHKILETYKLHSKCFQILVSFTCKKNVLHS